MNFGPTPFTATGPDVGRRYDQGGSEEIMMDLGVRQAMKEWAVVQSKM